MHALKGEWEERGGRKEGWIVWTCCVRLGECECACFVMMHYSFSSGTHGKVFTKPSAKIARLNWADVQLLRKWMLFKGASQCCTPVIVKGPSLSLSLCLSLALCLFLHLFMLMCLKLISHILQSDVMSVPASKKITIILFLWFSALACMFASVVCFKCRPLRLVVPTLSLISALNYSKARDD